MESDFESWSEQAVRNGYGGMGTLVYTPLVTRGHLRAWDVLRPFLDRVRLNPVQRMASGIREGGAILRDQEF